MANTAIVASNIVGIRLVRAISEALQSLDQRSALDRLLPCYHANVHGTFLLNSTCSSVVKTLHEQANIIKKSPLRDQRQLTNSMGVSSTRVGDHRGSARTVQFLNISFTSPTPCRLCRFTVILSKTHRSLWKKRNVVGERSYQVRWIQAGRRVWTAGLL